MPTVTQFCVGLDNKPGMLAKLCADMKAAKVNIEALFVSDDEKAAWVNFVPSPNTNPEQALADGGYRYVTEKVLAVPMMNQPGALEGIATRLADADVNIDYVYGSCGDVTSFMLVLAVDDLPKAAKALDTE